MNQRGRALNILNRLGVGIATAVVGALAAAAIQLAGTMFVGLPMAYLPWLVTGFAVVGFVCGMTIGTRKVGVSQVTPDMPDAGGSSVQGEDSRLASGNPYQSPGVTEACRRPGQLSITALLHAACDGCAWFLVVSVISAIAVFFIAGWPGAVSPGGSILRVFVVLLAATIAAVMAVISSLSKSKWR
jgi:hypothetical protein